MYYKMNQRIIQSARLTNPAPPVGTHESPVNQFLPELKSGGGSQCGPVPAQK